MAAAENDRTTSPNRIAGCRPHLAGAFHGPHMDGAFLPAAPGWCV